MAPQRAWGGHWTGVVSRFVSDGIECSFQCACLFRCALSGAGNAIDCVVADASELSDRPHTRLLSIDAGLWRGVPNATEKTDNPQLVGHKLSGAVCPRGGWRYAFVLCQSPKLVS